MAVPFIASYLCFGATFNLDTGKISLEDFVGNRYNTVYGFTLANVKELFKITGPNDIVIYENDGWETDDFTSPDIVGSGGWTFANGGTGILIPLDSAGGVQTGYYTFESKVTDGVTVWSTSKTYPYGFVPPVLRMEHTVSCRTSELTYTDLTAMTVEEIVPTVARAHTFTQPAGAGMVPAPGLVNSSTVEYSRTIGGDPTDPEKQIWTGVFQSSVSEVLTYAMEQWLGHDWIVITLTLEGYEGVPVKCDDCYCLVRTCIANLHNKWESILGTNPVEEKALQDKIIKVHNAWMQYEMAERCGEDYAEFCVAIQDIVGTESCTCLDEDFDVPHAVIPYAGSGPGAGERGPTGPTGPGITGVSVTGPTGPALTGPTGPTGPPSTGPEGPTGPGVTGPTGERGTHVYRTDGKPTNDIGENGDWAIDITNKELYYKEAGSWTLQWPMKGDTGPTGIGVTGPSGPIGIGATGMDGATGPTGPVTTGPTGPTGVGVTGPTGEGEYTVEVVTLSEADLKAINSGVELIAARDGSSVIDVLRIMAINRPVTAAYTLGDDLLFCYDNGGLTFTAPIFTLPKGIVQAGGQALSHATLGVDGRMYKGCPLMVYAAANFATGEGSVELQITYRHLLVDLP